MLRLLNEGLGAAASLMSSARRLLETSSVAVEPVLQVFEWARPSLTYGVLVRPEDLLDLGAVSAFGLDIAQRPTGGGVMFHVEDCSFSLLIPSTHAAFTSCPEINYEWVNRCVARAIEACMGSARTSLLDQSLSLACPRAARFCMSQPTRYDILWDGRKVGGAAQRQTRSGFLHQGSIALQQPNADWIHGCIRDADRVQAGMAQHAGALLDSPTPQLIQDLRRSLHQSLHRELLQEVERRHDDSVMMETL